MAKFVKINDKLINIDNIECIYEESYYNTIIDLVSGKSILFYGNIPEIEKNHKRSRGER